MMKIKSIHISNYRGFSHLNIDKLDAQSNLFIGVNGAGKSSVLDAISLLLSYFTKRICNPNGRGGSKIPIEDITIDSKHGTTLSIELTNGLRWTIYRNNGSHKYGSSDLHQLNKYILSIRRELEDKKYIHLPIIEHYKVSRAVLVESKGLKPKKKKNTNLISNIYNNSLDGKTSFNDFFAWYREQEDVENEKIRDDRDYRDHGLEAIRLAMHSIFPEYSNMRVQRNPRALVIKKGDTLFHLNQLSDGEKCYITLVCDLASKLAIANPTSNPLLGEGIVLIDEVDLHLHPQWQLSIITKLTKTFPNCQFIFTTHSPIVASDAGGSVWGLKQGELIPLKTFGRMANTILAEAFDVPNPRNQYIQTLIDKTYEAIHSNDAVRYEQNIALLLNSNAATEDICRIKLEKVRWEQNSNKQ